MHAHLDFFDFELRLLRRLALQTRSYSHENYLHSIDEVRANDKYDLVIQIDGEHGNSGSIVHTLSLLLAHKVVECDACCEQRSAEWEKDEHFNLCVELVLAGATTQLQGAEY